MGGSHHRKSNGIRATVVIAIFLISCVFLNALAVSLWLFSLPTPPSETNESEKNDNSAKSKNDEIMKTKTRNGVPVVAHVVSLIKCSKSVTGFLDSAAILRHSIHQQSVHNPQSTSRYSYEMYAIVHEECALHADVFKQLGYTTLIRPSPVTLDQIREGWYRDHVERENCCGSKEFIKLYAYQLTQHPVVVHWDLDVILLKPMDDLFDAILYPSNHHKGLQARQRIQLQHPKLPLPDQIGAFFTRDVTSSQPWEKVQGVQGGFLVARPSHADFNTYLQFIREANYTRGRGVGSGWGSLGYGGFQGAMAYQGVVAYFYDLYRPNSAVELDVCRWNQVVADVLWRGPNRKQEFHLQCRQYSKLDPITKKGTCEDCRITPISQVNSVHYTACKKPWECSIPKPRVGRNEAQQYRLNHLTNVTTCGRLFAKWFDLRRDLEGILQERAGTKPSARDGSYTPEYFGGYCTGGRVYIPMSPPPLDFDINAMYFNNK